ncbi:pyruvate dehydrogenase E1 component alpha subunit [Psychromicrobium silvestre]|uniref:2-oxoisovalerate dehydrogenase subunit alpha n=1 Tax=Psychromicrobium silvestre TaxID=1645614 RepID=A0A7Y9LSE0_9MICC|nr:thiamine pyrophosphate-dependent enzyme [Psychromicrobium silvestre]NYE94712.1 pyruvate dehydrogenase E1 component alpha subunit [Psychromicrobium silvestre]
MTTPARSERRTTASTLPVAEAVLSAEQQRELYCLLEAVRHLDASAIGWQRQGIVPAYAPERGQEAAQVGSTFALDRKRDFIFPTYRELGVARAWGVDMVAYMSTHKASWHGGLYDPMASRFAPIQAVVAGSVLHAVGWAHGQTLNGGDGEDDRPDYGVAISYFGDGASSQGDVHEAMNFASVFKAPVIFFVQNNGWAISVPTERQVAGGSVAARAAGYGMPAIQVDGNDVEAVYAATKAAREHAASGRGPVLIEAMTYRRGPHSTSDDPGRYRSLEEERQEGGLDPVERYAERLRQSGVADEAFFTSALAQAKAEEEQIRAGVIALEARPGREMFDFVYQEPTDELQQQAASWREESEHA